MQRRLRFAFVTVFVLFQLGVIDAHAQNKDLSKKQAPTQYWPEGIEYDQSIPTPREFFGFDVGFRHLSHSQVAGYVKALAESSDRISIQQYATSHGGRPLLMLTITSADNRKRLDEIRQLHRGLTKPDSEAIDQESLNELPAVINMGYGVHGDEPSATNCAPLVAYYLAAAKGEEIEAWLKNCIILLDPSLNPDGFNRFANWANRYRGVVLNPDPAHAEHRQMWPPGRVNYYWFDLNRDWLPAVHPESQGRLNLFHQWKPNVVLDFHEMGTNSTYFFQPGIPQRTNPMTPARNQELTRKFATYHAKALDDRGSLYFTQELFDDFYMGKGSTYPDLHGSVGILFEQASARGHMQRNQDGILKFTETIGNQFTTSLSSLRATTAMRMELLEYKRRFYQKATEMSAAQKVKTYLFQCPHNVARLSAFAATLRRHDIESYWLSSDLEYGDRTFDADFTLVVPADQAEYRFLRSLLMRRKRFKENIFYDVSSWTLPLAYGIEQTNLKKTLDRKLLVPFGSLDQSSPGDTTFDFANDDLGYVIDVRSDSAMKLLAELLMADISVRVARKPFTVAGDQGPVDFGYGTLVVPLQVQPEKREQVTQILSKGIASGVVIKPLKTSLNQSGPDIGSSSLRVIEKPAVAMLIGRGVSAYSAGEVWHLLDSQYRMPVTLLKNTDFAGTDLSSYSTLVLADGRLSDSDLEIVSEFASEGGTVVAIGRLAVSLSKRLTDGGSSKEGSKTQGSSGPEQSRPEKSRPEKSGAEKSAIQKPFDSASNERALKLISGAIFRTHADLTHPLLYGFSDRRLAVFRNHASFLEPSKNPYCNPLVYDGKQPLMAGYCSDENVQKFKGSASVVVEPIGKGRFVLMADNPNFRGFWKATNRVFMNAIFFGNLVDPPASRNEDSSH